MCWTNMYCSVLLLACATVGAWPCSVAKRTGSASESAAFAVGKAFIVVNLMMCTCVVCAILCWAAGWWAQC